MEEFELSAKALCSILEKKGVEYLYHANTVGTSITFIRNNALMSRKFVEEKGLGQTPQKSDKKDKTHDVWDHVFVDGMDLHQRYNQHNFYGPVLFRMKLDMLRSPAVTGVYITRNNPIYWNEKDTLKDKYYSDLNEFEQDYLTGKVSVDARIMITIRNPERRISLKKFLDSIVIDMPTRYIFLPNKEQKQVGKYAYDWIKETMEKSGLRHKEIIIRHEGEGIHYCRCVNLYSWMKDDELKEKFGAKLKRNEIAPELDDDELAEEGKAEKSGKDQLTEGMPLALLTAILVK